MKEIQLNRGYTMVVDDEDYERVSQHNFFFRNKSGDIATNISRQGKSTTITLPRFLLGIDDPSVKVAYVNRDVFDNRKSNLKIMNDAQIEAKKGKRTAPASSKYKGVSWDKRREKWRAVIQLHGKTVHLKFCDSEVLAAQYYDAAAKELHGDLAYLNFPDDPKPLVMHTSLPEKAGKRKRKKGHRTSRYIGVSANGEQWRCSFQHKGKRYASSHDSEAEAAYAYDKLAIEHRGVDAILNFPDHWRRQRQQFA